MAKKLNKRDLQDWYVVGITDFVNLMSTDLPKEFKGLSDLEIKKAITGAISEIKSSIRTEVH